MKKALIAIVIIAIVAVVGFKYATRAPEAPSADISSTTQGLATSTGAQTYRIQQEGSVVKFSIYELLYKKPFTAVGTSSQIAGDIQIKADSIATSEIKINARTFKTDSPSRDGAIVRFILKAENPGNEFITIAPISVPVKLAAGKTAMFAATTTLTVSGVSKPATFNVTVRDEGAKLAIVVEGKVKRSDFNLQIPNLSFLADVADEVGVNAQLTANRAN